MNIIKRRKGIVGMETSIQTEKAHYRIIKSRGVYVIYRHDEITHLSEIFNERTFEVSGTPIFKARPQERLKDLIEDVVTGYIS